MVVPDPPTSSKESVWAAKLEHGVVCSYYDLFLRCCIKFALANDGAMPTDECFPCVSDCDCTDISIGYTTQGMQVNEEQTLTVEGGVDGCVYAWAITSGGGELSAGTGTSVIYTAPASNPNCDENATISLSVEGNICDTLQIAISAYSSAAYAYEIVSLDAEPSKCCSYAPFSCGPSPPHYPPCPAVQYCGPKTEYTCKIYGCTGDMLRWCGSYFCHMTIPHDNYPGSIGCYTYAGNQRCGYGKGWGTYDLRSDAKKAGGCCPAALL